MVIIEQDAIRQTVIRINGKDTALKDVLDAYVWLVDNIGSVPDALVAATGMEPAQAEQASAVFKAISGPYRV